jgi:hypothetical protein
VTEENDNFRRHLDGAVYEIAGETEETVNGAATEIRTGVLPTKYPLDLICTD